MRRASAIRRSRYAAIVLAAVALSPFGLVHAQGQRFDLEMMETFAARLFDQMDLDHDGILSKAEHLQTQGGGFMVDYALLDLNGDGSVTKAEYLLAVRRYHPPRHPAQPI